MPKRGQVAIFVIVALVIVVGVALVYFLVPGVRTVFIGDVAPANFISSCVENEVKLNLERLSSQGGYADPEGFILHDGKKVKYFCYTSQYYLPCKVQQPLIKRNFERELMSLIETKIDSCVQDLIQDYEARGYTVSGVEPSGVEVEIAPENVKVFVEAPMTVSKDDSAQTFRTFRIDIPSKIYDLIYISTSIVDFESTYGDAETTLYYRYYPNILIEKDKLTDGTTVYGVRDVTTEEEFNFASRSLAWPGGYGLDV